MPLFVFVRQVSSIIFSSRRPSRFYSLLCVTAGCHEGRTASICMACLSVGQVCVQSKYAFISQDKCFCSASVDSFLVDIFNLECVCQCWFIHIYPYMSISFVHLPLSRFELSACYSFLATPFVPSPDVPLSCQSPDPPTKRQPNHITQLIPSPS